MSKIKQRGLVIFILGLLSAIGPFSIDMYLPGFQDIADDLGTTISHVGMSLSTFFIGISVGQVIYGPLLDRFGRKPLIYIGLGIYILSSLRIALVVTGDQLLWMRFIQALGSCVGMVASRALVRDIFPVQENAKVFSYLMLVIAISPIIAPSLGSFVISYYSWRVIFIILAFIAVLAVLGVYFFVPAGNLPDPEVSLKPLKIVKQYVEVSKNAQFRVYALSSAVSSAGLYAYLSGSPTLFLDIFKVSKEQYGIIFAIIAFGMVIANQINTVLLKKHTSEQISFVAVMFQAGVGLFLAISTYFGWLNMYLTIAAIASFMATQGFVYPNTSALSIAPFSRNAGTASALMGAVQLGIGAISSSLVATFTKTSAFPMGFAIFLCGFTSFMILFFGRTYLKRLSLSV